MNWLDVLGEASRLRDLLLTCCLFCGTQANLWVGKEYEEIAKLYKREAGARKRTRDEMEEDTLDSLMEDLAAE